MNYVDRLSAALRHAAPAKLASKTLGRHATVGDLRRLQVELEYTCSGCGTSRSFDPRTLPFGDLQLVVAVHRRMRCSFCGAQGETSLTRPAIARPMVSDRFR